MKVTILGSSAAYPAAGGAASGYLVQHDGFNLWMDAGTGTLANIQKLVPYWKIDAVLISHDHPDHCVDLYPVYIARQFHPDALDALPVYGPSGVFDRVGALALGPESGKMREILAMKVVEPGSSIEIGPFRIVTRLLPHWVPNIGVRLEADGVALAYTGDTGPDDGVAEIGREADLLIAEASWQDGHESEQRYHLTSREAAEHAAAAGARRLMLSHFWPGMDRDVSREQAEEAYGAEIVLATEGLTLEITS
jgi:ribonuclease BN (tRNA processing enzyme)